MGQGKTKRQKREEGEGRKGYWYHVDKWNAFCSTK